jgi:pantoate--beta-alanine ligase
VTNIEIIHSIAEMQRHTSRLRKAGSVLCFVPTMGFLHEGHLSLMREARKHGDVLILSIFVNPTQFGPDEDFETYPRDLERDLQLAENESADVVFIPDRQQFYGARYQTQVTLQSLPNHLCGLSRPHFFGGVATIVTKLFNVVQPHVAVFGEKDFQQLMIVRQMVDDLNFDIKIVGAPIVREPDGLAMSSRNAYLKGAQRTTARCLYQGLCLAQQLVSEGEASAVAILAKVKGDISALAETSIDYITICDPDTLENVDRIDQPVLMAMAVKVGQTRLIDNMILKP